MIMKFNVERFKAIAKPANPDLMAEINYEIENEDWLHIAISLVGRARGAMRTRGITQAQLAQRLGVSPSEVCKLLSGRENLSIQTISKLERAIGVRLMIVCDKDVPLTEKEDEILILRSEPMLS